jgi:hypothetical protein
MPTDSELLKIYWDAHAQFGPFDVGPDHFVRMFRDAERQEKTPMNIDLTNHHPCPVCRRVLTDQPLCSYCQETAALRKDLFAANMRTVRLRVKLEFLISAARAVIVRWDSIDWKNTEHTGVVVNRLRAALTAATEDKTT